MIRVSFFSSMGENLVKNRDIFGYTRKKCYLCTKKSSMNENIESVKKYNLWFGNTIDCGFPVRFILKVSLRILAARW